MTARRTTVVRQGVGIAQRARDDAAVSAAPNDGSKGNVPAVAKH